MTTNAAPQPVTRANAGSPIARSERYSDPLERVGLRRFASRAAAQNIKLFLLSLATALLIFSFLNGPVLITNLLYYANRFGIVGSSQSENGFAAAAANAPIATTPTLIVPKLNIRVPIIFDQSGVNARIKTELQNGVVHFAGTALPGQNGNVAIFGHSSNNIFAAGNYKFIFTMLNKLRPSDQIEIDYKHTRYLYQMTGSKVVAPSDSTVLDATVMPTLSLITCTPVGTNLNRLVVVAKQITPDPSQNAAAIVVTTNPNQLPGN